MEFLLCLSGASGLQALLVVMVTTMAIEPDLAALSGRISHARVLREHHVWEAAKAVSPGLLGRGAERTHGRFTALMEADALVDAVLLLASLAEPRRSVSRLIHGGERWICTMRCGKNGAGHGFKAEHADLAAVLLASFLQSYRRRRPCCDPGRAEICVREPGGDER